MSNYPIAWKECLLGEVVGRITSGGTPKADNHDLYGGDIPFLKIDDITSSSKYLTNHKATINERGLSESSAKIVPAGTLLLTMYGTIGRCCITTYPVATNQAIASFLEHPEIAVEYLYYALEHKAREFAAVSSQTTQANISASVLKQTRIAIPPLPEQKKIAEILSGIDRAINANQSLLQKLKSIKTAIGNEFCSGAPDGPHELIDLAELVEHGTPICYGILMPGNNFPGGVPVVKVKNILNGSIVQDDLLLTDPEIDQKYERSRIAKGDLLITIRGTTGRTAIVPGNLDQANITQDTARIRVKSNVSTELIRIYLDSASGQKYIQDHTIGQAVKGINLADLRKMPIPLKVIELNMRATDLVASINARIALLATKINKLRSNRVAVASDLLSGRKRVTP
jgi:type I restriction enzyme S subunit